MQLRVFYVGSFSKPWSTENYVAYGLEQSGVEVVRHEEETKESIQGLLSRIKEFNPDFVLFSKARVYTNPYVLMEELKNLHIKTVSWTFDLYFGLPLDMSVNRGSGDANFRCDMVFSTDAGHDVEWKKYGVNHFLLRQGIHEPEAVKGKKLKTAIPEVLFIGSDTYGYRSKLIKFLRATYGDANFRHYGQGGTHPEVRGMELNNILASTKVVVGDSVPSPQYWSNRIYEILGRGGFLIHPWVAGIEKEFIPYEHFIPYDYGNLEQVKKIVDYYITHDRERVKIQKAGYEWVKKQYTYTKRCQTLLQKITGTNEPANWPATASA